jgi:FkbM family methyltransferase
VPQDPVAGPLEAASHTATLYFGQFLHRSSWAIIRVVGRYSQGPEDLLIRHFFEDHPPRSKCFCDVGAYDGITHSNTRALFEQGWQGLLIEAHPRPYAKLEKLYKGTDCVVLNCAAGATTGEVPFYSPIRGPSGLEHSSCLKSWTERFPHLSWSESTVAMKPFRELIKSAPGPIDLLSIDCEGMDAEILRNAEFPHRERPLLIIAERAPGATEEIDRILKPLGYEQEFTTMANQAWAFRGPRAF